MTLLTTAEYRAFDPVADIEDAALQLLLDAAEADIVRVAGPVGSYTEYVDAGGRLTILGRQAAAIGSVTETARLSTSPVTLSADDYLLWPRGTVLERLGTGTHPRSYWSGRVTVTYTLADDSDIRKVVQRDLVSLALNYSPGLTSTTVGSWTEMYSQAVGAQEQERQSILARLSDGPRMAVMQ
jgi:hypothetical protein